MEQLPTEFKNPFKYVFLCFTLMGNSLFPNKNLKYYLNLLCIFTLFPIFYIFMTKYILGNMFSGGIEFYELAFVICPYMIISQGLMKRIIMVNKRFRLEKIILQLSEEWRDTGLSKQQKDKKNALLKRLTITNTGFFWMNILCGVQYCAPSLIQTVLCAFHENDDCDWLMPFACSYPFDISRNLIVYLILFIHQLYGGLFMHQGTILMLYTLCGHLTNEFMILEEDLLLVNNKKKTDLRDIIKKHQLITGLAKELDDIFNKLIFIDILFATMTIGLFGFVVKYSQGPYDMWRNFTPVVAGIIPIYNMCYYAQHLSDNSAGVADAAYNTRWYTGDSTYKKCICIIITRAQNPCYITSLGYAPISLNTFSKVLSTTWSYFSLVNSVYEKE